MGRGREGWEERGGIGEGESGRGIERVWKGGEARLRYLSRGARVPSYVTVARRRLCETRPEKLKPEARRANSGDGVGFLGRGSKPPPNLLQGVRVWVSAVSSPSGVRGGGRSCGKMWFWCISGFEKSTNLDISELVDRFQLMELCVKHLTIVRGL